MELNGFTPLFHKVNYRYLIISLKKHCLMQINPLWDLWAWGSCYNTEPTSFLSRMSKMGSR